MAWDAEFQAKERERDRRQGRLMALSVMRRIDAMQRKRAVVIKVVRRKAVR